MSLKLGTYLIIAVFLGAGCASNSTQQFPQEMVHGESVAPRTVEDIIAREQAQEQRVLTTAAATATTPKLGTTKKFKLNYRPKHFNFWKKYFSEREEERFKRHLRNGLRFKSIVDRVFSEHGLPRDLFYVGLIESGYNTHIKSRASAVGPWQFIKGTADRYGLRVDGSVDERRSIYKASVAAAGYFKDLYNIFGSWELALCAYNAGEYRIINAIRKGNTRDYVELVKKKLIPRETIFYVPKVAAAKHLIETKYKHMMSSDEEKFYRQVKMVTLKKSFSAEQVRKSLRMSRKDFKLLNPELKRDWIKNRSRKGFVIAVPESTGSRLIASLGALKSQAPARERRQVASRTKRPQKATQWHRVKRGQSLSTIARRHGLTVSKLKALNKLKRDRIYPGQRLVVANSFEKGQKTHYIVRKGDYLGKIARRFNTSVIQLKRLNGLRKSAIRVGQRLRVSKDNLASKLYVVRKGDSLYAIAKRFGVTIKTIVRANSLARKTIYPRQKIIIPLNS